MDKLKIDLLLEKYYAGDTSAEEEKILFDFFSGEVPEAYREHAAEFKALHLMNTTYLKSDEQLEKKIEKRLFEGPKVFYLNPVFLKRMAAAVLLLITGYYAGNLIPMKGNVTGSQVGEDENLKTVYVMLEKPLANDRLEGLRLVSNSNAPDDRILDALIHVLNSDANENVRLEALHTLSRYLDNPKVRKGVVNSIAEQTSDVVLLDLLDLMLATNEKQSIPQWESVLQKQKFDERMREEIQTAISKIKSQS